jgi:DNA-binding beta-propeller fold protein YncE
MATQMKRLTPQLYLLALILIVSACSSGSGSVGSVSSVGVREPANIRGTDSNQSVYQIEEATGISTCLSGFGLAGFPDIQGLAFDPNTNTLYGTDSGKDQLVIIDTATGGGTAVGPLSDDFVPGLAFDPNTDTLYGVNGTGKLITMDTATGSSTVIGPTLAGNIQGLAFDPNTNTLYGSSVTLGNLVTLDTTTGAATRARL